MANTKPHKAKNTKLLGKLKLAITKQKEEQARKKEAEAASEKKDKEKQAEPKEIEKRLEQKVEEEAKEDLPEVGPLAIPRRPAANIEEELGLGELRLAGEKKPELPEEQKQYVERKGGAAYASAAVTQEIRTYMVHTGVFGSALQFTPQTLENLAEPERRRVFEMASKWTGISFDDYSRLQGAVQDIFSPTQQYVSQTPTELPRQQEGESMRKYFGKVKT